MAKIPIYNRRVQSAGAPRARQAGGATGDNFGGVAAREDGALGGALQKFGGEMGNLADVIQQRKDAVVVQDRINALNEQTRKHLDNTYKMRGAQAADEKNGAVASSSKFFEQQEKAFVNALNTPRQQEMFKRAFNSVRNGAMDSVSRFASQEWDRYHNEVLDGAMLQAQEQAIQERNNPGTLASAKALVEINTAKKYLGVGGVLPEGEAGKEMRGIITNRQREAVQSLVASVYEAVAKDSPEAGLEFLEANKGDLDPAYVAGKEKFLRTRIEDNEAYRTAFDLSKLGVSEEAALNAADTQYEDNPDLLRKTRSEIKIRFADNRRIEEQNRRDLIESAWNTMLKEGTMLNLPEGVPEVELLKMREYMAKVKLAGQKQVISDPEKYTQLVNLLQASPSEFATLDPKDYYPYLSQKDREWFDKSRKEAREGVVSQANKSAIAVIGGIDFEGIAEDLGVSNPALLKASTTREWFKRVEALGPKAADPVELEKLEKLMFRAPASLGPDRVVVPYIVAMAEKDRGYVLSEDPELPQTYEEREQFNVRRTYTYKEGGETKTVIVDGGYTQKFKTTPDEQKEHGKFSYKEVIYNALGKEVFVRFHEDLDAARKIEEGLIEEATRANEGAAIQGRLDSAYEEARIASERASAQVKRERRGEQAEVRGELERIRNKRRSR